jgi:hypothetical protein
MPVAVVAAVDRPLADRKGAAPVASLTEIDPEPTSSSSSRCPRPTG